MSVRNGLDSTITYDIAHYQRSNNGMGHVSFLQNVSPKVKEKVDDLRNDCRNSHLLDIAASFNSPAVEQTMHGK